MGKAIMELKNVRKDFGSVSVLKGISLVLERGRTLGLVGENGAGKSTLMNILGGVYAMTSGEMRLDGEPYSPRNPKEASEKGIAFIHQELNLFTNLTVAENICLDTQKRGQFILSSRQMGKTAESVLDRLGVTVSAGAVVEELPVGMRQMVEIAKALSKEAKIVIFDEPTSSLSTPEKKNLFRVIRELSQAGIALIYISHALDDVLDLCDEILVIRDGEQIGEQTPKSMITKEKMIRMMVGREMGQLYPYNARERGGEYLRVSGLTNANGLRNVDLVIRGGEIVGLFGLMGAGRSELARAVYGLDPIDGGTVFFMGTQERNMSPGMWLERGMAFITENRREEGLLLPKCVQENISLVNLDKYKTRFGVLSKSAEKNDCAKTVSHLRIKSGNPDQQAARHLSGGNQQKAVIGKWLLINPKVLIMDEPTRGVDVGAKYEIYSQINDIAEKGSAILFISSEMEELIGICDRIAVMYGGRITGERARGNFSQESLLKLAIGDVA
ncbi:MAG: sugar ABC transporter ATP-binding protein [Synergistaceae bacterium]|nr:sugar ABC transporter ATP-binding protein [Synergistaceae bacterium]